MTVGPLRLSLSWLAAIEQLKTMIHAIENNFQICPDGTFKRTQKPQVRRNEAHVILVANNLSTCFDLTRAMSIGLGTNSMHEGVGKSKTFAAPVWYKRSSTPNNDRDGAAAMKALITQQSCPSKSLDKIKVQASRCTSKKSTGVAKTQTTLGSLRTGHEIMRLIWRQCHMGLSRPLSLLRCIFVPIEAPKLSVSMRPRRRSSRIRILANFR